MPAKVKRIGIGIDEDAQKVIDSANGVKGNFTIVCYSRPGTVDKKTAGTTLGIIEHINPGQALIDDLVAGRIDAAVRGTLPANSTLRALKKAEGVDHLERIALLETVDGKKFLLTPVGVDEGWTVPEKLELIKKGRQIAQKFGLPGKVGVLSGGRLGDVHLGIVHRTLRLGGPGAAGLGEIGKYADKVEFGEILEFDAVGRGQFAAKNQMQQLFGRRCGHSPFRRNPPDP